MAKLKYSSIVVQEFFVSENHHTGAPSYMQAQKKSQGIFSFFFLRGSFQFFSLMYITSIMHITSASRICPIEMLTTVWQSLFQTFR